MAHHLELATRNCLHLQAVVIVVICAVIVVIVVVGGVGGVVVRTGGNISSDRRIGRLHAALWFPLSRLNAVLFHSVRSIHTVQLVVKAAGVADWLAHGVTTPQRCHRRLTIAARCAYSPRSGQTAARFLLEGATGATIPTEAFVEIALVRHGTKAGGGSELVLRRR